MEVDALDYRAVSTQPRLRSGADPAGIAAAVEMIAKAKRPYLYAGAGVLFSGASAELVRLAELLTLPTATTLNGKSAFPENHPLSLGLGGFVRGRYHTLPAAEIAGKADVIVAVGCGFKYEATRKRPHDGVKLIQIDVEPGEINRSQLADVALLGDARLVLNQLVDHAKAHLSAERLKAVQARQDEIDALKRRWSEISAPLLESTDMPINPFRVTKELCALIDPKRTIMLHDAGTVRGTICYHYMATEPRGFLGFGAASSMGWSLGAALGAKKAHPDKLVVALIGEEAFQETAMDLETSVRNEAPVMIIVNNNRKQVGASSRNDRRLDYARFHSGLDIRSFAESLGAHAVRIADPDALSAGLAQAIARVEAGRTTVVEIVTTRMNPVLDKFWAS
jgi:acetolactate synthase-1/2/3 large subunit